MTRNAGPAGLLFWHYHVAGGGLDADGLAKKIDTARAYTTEKTGTVPAIVELSSRTLALFGIAQAPERLAGMTVRIVETTQCGHFRIVYETELEKQPQQLTLL
jgi:hypothetical protein